MADTKINTLVAQQLPEFIRNDYNTFVLFLEAYYAWMEESGNPLSRAVEALRSINIDTSLTEFMEYYCKEFIPSIPEHLIPNKAFLISHAKEFYRSKGTKASFELLFKILYNETIDMSFPGDSILRVSDGKWEKKKSIRLDPTLWSNYTADGSTREYRLLAISDDIGEVEILVDGVVQNSGFIISKNRPYLIFDAAPSVDSIIRINYQAKNIIGLFNTNVVVATVLGVSSGTTAVTETGEQFYIQGVETFNLNLSSIIGQFQIGEEISLNYVYDTTENLSIVLMSTLVSLLDSISVVDGGANYNVGDYVPIIGGDPSSNASGVIEEVYNSIITDIIVVNGGCGYQAGQEGYITSTPNTGLSFAIGSVDTSERIHPNSYPIGTDVISLFQNTIISNINYGFSSAGTENANTIMLTAFSSVVYGGSGPQGLGPITNVAILLSTQSFITGPTLKIDAPVVFVTCNTANGNTATANVSLAYFGILGRMRIVTGGTGYTVGDELSFINVPGIGIGIGGAGEVTSVHNSNAGIKTVNFQPSRITGTVNVSSNVITGVGTAFTTELFTNDRIEVNNESSFIQSITNNTHLITNTAFVKLSTNRKLGVYGRYFVGGVNYSSNAFPTVTVSSANGAATGANIICEGIISSGEILNKIASDGHAPGEIRTIRVSVPGYGYLSVPEVNLSSLGNGRANALALLITSLFTSEGHYTNQDGMLSSDRKIQGVDAEIHEHSYVIKSAVALATYKNIFKSLVHPAGLQLFGEYVLEGTPDVSVGAYTSEGNVWITTP